MLRLGAFDIILRNLLRIFITIILFLLFIAINNFTRLSFFTAPQIEPVKEVFIINIEQYSDASYFLQYSIDGAVQEAMFNEWDHLVEYVNFLETKYIIVN